MPTEYELPAGHHTVTPGFSVPGVARLLEFIERAFGGVVTERYDMPDGNIAHAEVRLGDSIVMMGETMPGSAPMPAMLSLYVDDVDGTYARAMENGATSLQAPANQFYGYRSARVRDPSGNHWSICAVVENLTKDEIERRMAGMGGGSG